MNFYKIVNGELVSGSGLRVPDDTFSTDWSILETDANGQHFKFYNTDGTANLVKEQAEADQVARQAWKESRTLAVSQIIVTTASGKKFDGGETSQTRMSRAVAVLDPGETQPWILAENLPGELPVDVTKEELKEALRLAGKEQTAIWAY
jgi:hypothetical protein